MSRLLLAFLLTLLAGLSTGIGSALAFFAKKTNTRFLSFSLGFSAGVMIYVSFVEILSKSRYYLSEQLGDLNGYWVSLFSFFGGILLIAVIDKLVPSVENPHEIRRIEDTQSKEKQLNRIGILTALAIAIHNFPEGLATFTAALTEPGVGIAITVAIAIHNIPEGIAVSVPIFYATGNRKKAFWLSFLSGLAEPVGAVIGYLILLPFLTPVLFGIVFGAIAGIMVFISLDELLPAAREFGEHHISIYGLIMGMLVMAVSLALFI